MKITVNLPRGFNARDAIRRCGYGEHAGAEASYARRLGSYLYPRFHVYIADEAPGRAVYNLHLDQKQPSYEGNHAHSGEYDGDTIEREAERIQAVIAHQEEL